MTGGYGVVQFRSVELEQILSIWMNGQIKEDKGGRAGRQKAEKKGRWLKTVT